MYVHIAVLGYIAISQNIYYMCPLSDTTVIGKLGVSLYLLLFHVVRRLLKRLLISLKQ